MRNLLVRLRHPLSSFLQTKSSAVVALSFILATQAGCPNIEPTVKALFGGGNKLVDGLNISNASTAYFNAASSTAYTLTYVNTSSISLTGANISINMGGSVTGCIGALSGTGPTFTYTINSCAGTGPVSITVAANTALDNTGGPVAGVGPSAGAIVDNALPVTSCSNPSGTTFSNLYTVSSITCSDADSGCVTTQCRVDGGTWGSCTFVGLSNAAHTFEAQSWDNASNLSAPVTCGTITVNNSALAITSPAALTPSLTSASVSGTCVTGIPVDFALTDITSPSSTPCTAGAFSTTVNFTAGDGNKNISVSQTDMFAANISNSRILISDNTAPASPSITVTNKPYTNLGSDNLTLSASESVSLPMQMYISNSGCMTGGTGWIAYSSPYSFTLTANASNTIFAAFKDALGNTSGCASDTTIQDNTVPTFPVAVAVTGTPLINGGSNQTISWTTSDTNLDPAAVTQIEFFDGTSWGTIANVISNNGSNTNYSWTTPTASCNNVCKIRVTAKDLAGNTFSNTTATFSIVGALNHFALSYPASTTAGVAQTLSVTAQDINNLVLTNYTGTVNFSSNDGQAVLPASYAFIGADSGTHNFTGIVLKTAGLKSITVDNGAGISNTFSSISVNAAAADHLTITQQPSAALVAGQNFTPNVAVEIRDAYENLVTSAVNTISLSSQSDSICSLASTNTLTGTLAVAATGGVATFNSVGYTYAEQIYLKFNTAGLTSACSNAVTVNPAVADHFNVIWSGPGSVSAGDPYNLTVTALDPYNNIDVNYTGTATFSSSDAQVVGTTLPASYTFLAGDLGTKTFTGVQFRTAGASEQIFADDTPRSGQTAFINVNPAPADHLEITGPTNPHADECAQYTLNRKDPYNNLAPDASPISVGFSGLGPNSRIFSDAACLTDLAGNVGISTSMSNQNFYFYNTNGGPGFPENLTVNATDGVLTGAVLNLAVQPRLPWGNGNDGNVTVTTTMTNVNADTTLLGGRTFSAARSLSSTLSANQLYTSTTFAGSEFQTGDEIMWIVVGKGITGACDGADNYKVGQYGFARVMSTTTNSLTIDRNLPFGIFINSNLTAAPTKGTNFCRVMVQRVPQLSNLTFVSTGSLTAGQFSIAPSVGGAVILRVKNTLTPAAASYIDVVGKGYNGGAGGTSLQYEGSSFSGVGASAGGSGLANGTGGHRGFYSAANVGGGGGANAGYGGVGWSGWAINGRSTTSIGTFSLDKLFFGGGGGGAFHSTENRFGGNGGGIIMLYANTVAGGSGTLFLDASGQDAFMSATPTGYGGGGGGGGSILSQFGIISSGMTIDKNVKGGRGADVVTGSGGGGGGGGGYIHIDYCSNSGSLVNNTVGRIGGTHDGGTSMAESGANGVYQAVPTFCP